MRTHRVPIEASDRVIVVGAGPAGVHAASRLKARGVASVRVLERSNRIGGKAFTLRHEGHLLEMGACFLHSDYREVERLVTGLGLTPPRAVPRGSRTLYGSAHVPRGLLAIGRALFRYVRAHRRLLGRPVQGLYRRPDPATLDALSRSAAEWLRDEGLQVLEPMIHKAFVAQGYGYLEDAPALYLLLWLTPPVVRSLLLSAATRPLQARSPAVRARFAVTRVLPEGFGTVFTRLAERERLDITLGAEVTAVQRGEDVVVVSWEVDGVAQSAEADWLVWACPVPVAARVFTDLDDEEAAWFGGQASVTVATTAYRDRPVPGYTQDGYVIAYHLDRLDPARPGAWHADRHDGAIWGDATDPGSEARVAFQLVPGPRQAPQASARRFLDRLQADWVAHGRPEARPMVRDGRPIQCRWSFFQHLSADAVRRGAHWDILERQGLNRTVFLGASVWFESVEHVLRYNRAVLG